MSSSLIALQSVSAAYSSHTLFSNASATVFSRARIALTGDNGQGKTTLFRLLTGALAPSHGSITQTPGIRIGLLPQSMALDAKSTVWQVATELVHEQLEALDRFEQCNAGTLSLSADQYDELLETLSSNNTFGLHERIMQLLAQFDLGSKKDHMVATLSGGQRTMLGLIRLLADTPDLLLLDEPTNNLDSYHREQLLNFLHSFTGAAIIISHDVALLRSWPKQIWHLSNQQLHLFTGSYDEFVTEQEHLRMQTMATKEQVKKELLRKKREVDAERQRVAASKRKGVKKHGRDRKAAGAARERAGQTTGRLSGIIYEEQAHLRAQMKELHIPPVITPTFQLNAARKNKSGLFVRDGIVGYGDTQVLHNIQLAIPARERVALRGRNGSGKSTLLKALLQSPEVTVSGEWQLPLLSDIGLLDQHYSLITAYESVHDAIKQTQPQWSDPQIRTHLNTFLFRTNEQVCKPINVLSGGEQARLSLAVIAAHSPSVLFLDEITNNIDLATRQHCIEVLRAFPGTIVAISHDNDFLKEIGCTSWYEVCAGSVTTRAQE